MWFRTASALLLVLAPVSDLAAVSYKTMPAPKQPPVLDANGAPIGHSSTNCEPGAACHNPNLPSPTVPAPAPLGTISPPANPTTPPTEQPKPAAPPTQASTPPTNAPADHKARVEAPPPAPPTRAPSPPPFDKETETKVQNLIAKAVTAAYDNDIVTTDALVTEALKLDPRNSRAYNARGLARMNPDCPAAMPDFDMALTLNPKNTAALYNRGVCQQRSEQYEKARETYSRAIAANPNNTKMSREARAEVALTLKDFDAAIADYEYLLQHGGDPDSARVSICTALSQKGDYKAALDSCSLVIARNPKHLGARITRGDIFVKTGFYNAALNDYNAAIKQNGDVSYAYLGRGNAYRGVKNYVLAAADFDKALAIDPTLIDAADGLGRSYYELGESDNAIHALNEFLRKQPSAQAYYWLGRAYMQKNNNDKNTPEAQDCFRKALSIDPEHRGAKRFVQLAEHP